MALAQLIYISTCRMKMDQTAIRDISDHSEKKNAAVDISGALLSVGPHFMQLLEGELTDVTSLFERIRLDPRHHDVHCLLCKNVSKRIYPKWGMRLLDPVSHATLDRERLERLIEEFRVHRNTGPHGVEARVLLSDFTRQLVDAA